ncbi:hypothetical protein INT47_007662 [Mucor saturninus]|uniref:Uncharacterized protein n=1 Tax=Mucor saturninus TaxID=64648 RepID=A0A8H7UUM1_9FUNG|nr:hypothetical protein INT47_007662 [Mucor saturninus]
MRDKLYLKDFWTIELCDWTIVNYSIKLFAQDLALTRRSASNRLINGSAIIKNHVIAGTIAETMASTMSSFTQVKYKIELLNCIVLDDPVFIAEKKKLIVDICRTLNDYIYHNCGLEVLQKSESCHRSYLFDRCTMATTKYLRNVNHDITFLPGEIELNSMTTQLKQKGVNDGRYKYNADGTLIASNFSAIEILLTEVSSGYGLKEVAKISFDHYKAMFGMLAMIRTVAQLCEKASFNTFAKLIIHFLHAHGKQCHQTLVNVNTGTRPQKLSSIINPTIIRLNEGKHTNIVVEHGPMSVPNSPNPYPVQT